MSRPEMCWIESRKEWRKRKTIGGKTYQFYGKTKEEVRQQLKEAERAYEAGLVLNDATTLPAWAVKWFKLKTAGLSASAKSDYSNAINKHIVPVLGDMLLKDIKPSDVHNIMAECAHLSRRMQSRILGTMRQIMDAAVADGLIPRNPCMGVKPKGDDAAIKVPLSSEQQQALVAAAQGSDLELFVLLCLYAGLRREEALGLRWEHVSLSKTPYINVRAIIAYAEKGEAQYKEILKSDAARRSIPLPEQLELALKSNQRPSGFVLAGQKNKSWLPEKSYKRYWESLRTKVDFYISPHLLRHTYITELCASGIDIKKVQYLAGHSDPRITLKIYAHVKDNKPEDLIDAVRGAFKNEPLGFNLGFKRTFRVSKRVPVNTIQGV